MRAAFKLYAGYVCSPVVWRRNRSCISHGLWWQFELNPRGGERPKDRYSFFPLSFSLCAQDEFWLGIGPGLFRGPILIA
jgi:hypothetical protein